LCNAAYSDVREGQFNHFDGVISRSAADAFIRLATSNHVDHLIITSPGGDVASAIDMALLIFERKIDVEVTNYCFSSCANYIFPAANNNYITGAGIVAWHGMETCAIFST